MFIIYFHNWWSGFFTKQDANNIEFFEKLFAYTKFKDSIITNDINKANVLLEAGNPNETIHNYKKWNYKINFIGEPALPKYDKYDLILTSINNVKNIVDLPLSVAYIHCNNFLPNLINRPKITSVPLKFCTFIVSNPNSELRNNLFKLINNYKKVDSMGAYANNVGDQLREPYWSSQYFNLLSNYKFMICFENTKMETYSTEKIVNPYLGRTIPIYWGSHNIKNIFNIDSMLFLEDESKDSIYKLIEKIIELDNNDNKYLEFINRQILTEDNIQFWNENYIFDSLGTKIDTILN